MVCFYVFTIIFGKWVLFIPYLPSFLRTRKVSQEICFYSPSVLGMSCLFFSAAYGKCRCKHWEPWGWSSLFYSRFLLAVLFFLALGLPECGSIVTLLPQSSHCRLCFLWRELSVAVSPICASSSLRWWYFSWSYNLLLSCCLVSFILFLGGFHRVLFLTAFPYPHAS